MGDAVPSCLHTFATLTRMQKGVPQIASRNFAAVHAGKMTSLATAQDTMLGVRFPVELVPTSQ